MKKMLLAAGIALATISTAAVAAVTVDSSGFGSVGKGDIQLAFGWNNAAFQENHTAVSFSLVSQSSSESSWTCDKDGGPQTQERKRTTTTSTTGVVTALQRDKKQVVGYILQGFSGTPTIVDESEGPKLWDCPTNWTAIDKVTTELGGSGTPVLYATFNGTPVALN